MALLLSAQVLAVTPGGTATFTATCPTAIPGEPITAVSGDVTVCTVAGIGAAPGPVAFTVTGLASAVGGTTITVAPATDPTDTATLLISVAPATPNVPSGYTGTTAIAAIRNEIDEPTLPADPIILGFLNAGLEEVTNKLGGIRLFYSYPLSANQIVQALTADVQDVTSVSFSTGPVQSQGVIVYPLFQRDQASFMDFAAGFPAVGFGPPTEWWTFQDANNQQLIQIYPGAQPGLLNVYYRARPTLWTTNAGTNLDSSLQDIAFRFAIIRTLRNRGRSAEAKSIYEPEYKTMLEEAKADVRRRTNPKTGQVRDVYQMVYPFAPYWGLR